jgi:ferritin
MITKKIEKALNEQIALEASASYDYLAMASWFDKTGLSGAAKFMYEQSDEERGHMLKLFTYINEAGGYALAPGVAQPKYEYKTMLQIFEDVLKHEIHVTKAINKLVDLCLTEKDYSTFNFLQWYVSEQHEEEKLFTQIIDKIRIVGEDGKGIYWIDKELASMGARK